MNRLYTTIGVVFVPFCMANTRLCPNKRLPSTPSSLCLEELLVEIVTATKPAVNLTDVPAASSVITRQDILRYGYRNLAEALAHRPGSMPRTLRATTPAWFVFLNNISRRIAHLVNGHPVMATAFTLEFYPDGGPGDLQERGTE